MNNDRFLNNGCSRIQPLRITAEGTTATGTRHVVNQDRYFTDPTRGSYLVADGMGGMRAGETAAQMAIDLLPNQPALLAFENPTVAQMKDTIERVFFEVSKEIELAGNLDSRMTGMGTSAVFAQQLGGALVIAGLGDSRAYLYRNKTLRQYTIDHNMAQALVQMGVISREAARLHRWRHMLWKYLGAADLNEGPDISVIHLKPGDRFLLTTDGVTSVVGNRQLCDAIECHDTAEGASRAIVRAAVSHGTRDDATCVAIYVDPKSRRKGQAQ